ncbi:hypothetical protein ACWT_3610 [Actinoplanes sp. SE50]|uniref:DUF6069 family protein n=1 Tax=unclassified Actinoplanes TaxID=2626549 RepID=UPI00023EC46E|nr:MULTISPECIES: DUF6069 family protein [unclassified Actinoplanes]AEV84633.1 hypothetical protein ACPL_3738 [Actinoplanes sp. SE50/110]ATO83025.1 hypothetical protein ACWT_3610 [Actinoplanes sp. SE50]SLM00433.1 hypothetical protein ACSP50_3665 [Actinoplanes sp. SE50/110]
MSVLRTGLLATLAAMAATTVTAALARCAGVDFELPDGGQSIPLPGFAVMTGIFSTAGVLIAVALRRWSAVPAVRFVTITAVLTVLSLIAPVLSGGNPATVLALLALHLIAAAVMIPGLARSLSRPGG